MIDTLFNVVTLIILVGALWILAWNLWDRTFTFTRLDVSLTVFIVAKALFWTWVFLYLEVWHALFIDWLRWTARIFLILASIWVIVEVRRLPRKDGRFHRLWNRLRPPHD